MNNNKKLIIQISIITIILIIFLSLNTYFTYQKNKINNNIAINNLIENIKKQYPDIKEEELINIINNNNYSEDTISKYGLDLNNDYLNNINQKVITKSIIINIIISILYILIVFIVVKIHHHHNNKQLDEITNYLKQINNKNYDLNIKNNSEDKYSILKNELYKTAIYLNEQASISLNDKIALKNSLENISHQLKTPLTSINLMIDNLIDNNTLSKKEQMKYLHDINHKITNLNFLVLSLLKLSKFDSNTIEFNNKEYFINDILNEVKENLSMICDLKNITININGDKKYKINVDYKWQVEALTNIVKNCLEHSHDNSNIDITYSQNDIFSKIVIKDYGVGIPSKELPKIFERFYRCSNTKSNSIGIGLNLSKIIIEKNNGSISVESKLNKGTIFTIKYYK